MRAAGAAVVIVTARSPRSVRDLAREAGISGEAICANGAMVFDLDADEIVDHLPLPSEVGRRIATALRERLDGVVFGWELELRFGSEPAYEALRGPDWWPRPEGSWPPCDVSAWDRPFTKLLARVPAEELAGAYTIAREVAGAAASVTLTGNAFVEVMAPGASKRAALGRLAARRGLGQADVVAFGDHLTDLEMVAWAGHGVAVANAEPGVLQVADEVAPSNEDDGVAVVLEALLAARP